MGAISRIKKSRFLKDVTILASGTAVAQSILLLSSPILTRLYTPSDFGMLAIFLALVSCIIPMANGKYEVALVLPSRNKVANELFGVAIWTGVSVSSLFLLTIILFQKELLELLSAPDLAGWLYLAPAILLMTGLFNLGGYYANRHEQYRLMARSKLLQAAIIVGVSVILGLMNGGFVGLLLGNALGLFVAFIYLLYQQKSHLSAINLSWGARKYIVARRYADYPIYNATTGVLNEIKLSLPVFYLTYFYPTEIVGYYALVVRVLYAPLWFLSTAVSQVNLRKVVELVNDGVPICPYLYKITIGLIIFALVPSLIILAWGPDLFSMVFGKKWLTAGHYAQILAFSIAIRFVVSTLSSTFDATMNNKYNALWKLVSFFSTFIVLSIVAGNESVETVIIALALNDGILYCIYYYLVIMAAKKPNN